MVWYSHLFQNFPQFMMIHTVKGFGIVNRAEIDVFMELSCFFDDPADVGKNTTSLFHPWGFPHISVGKESACNAGDPSSIPGWGRSAGDGISYPW